MCCDTALCRCKHSASCWHVDDDTMMVRADTDFVMTHIASAPSQFTLTPRNSKRQITVGGKHVNFGMVSGPPNVSDKSRGRRSSQLSDFTDLIKLGQAQNNIQLYGNQTAATNDLAVHTRHLDSMLATLINSDKVTACMSVGRERVTDAMEMIALAREITLEEMKSSPSAVRKLKRRLVSVSKQRLKNMSSGLVLTRSNCKM